MGGEGPYVRFLNDFGLGFGKTSSMREPYALDDDQLDAAYTRARAFLLKRVRELVELDWKQNETDGSLLASLSYTRVSVSYWGGDRRSDVELRLPRTARALFDPSLVQQWKEMFEARDLLQVQKRRWSDSTPDRYADAYLFVDAEEPLRDIFNFLQCLIPDTLVIIRIDDIGDMGEEEITQRLPSSRWVDDHTAELRPIFGEERFQNVAQAARSWSCLSRMVSSYNDWNYEDEDDKDITACDKECGYCGRCPY